MVGVGEDEVKLYKATDIQGKTKEKTGWSSTTKWGEGIRHRAKKGHPLKAHLHPVLASLAQFAVKSEVFSSIRLWEAEGQPINNDILTEGERLTHNDRTFGVVKCSELATVTQIEVTCISSEALVKAGIICALEVCDIPEFVQWANEWSDGKDRTQVRTRAVYKKASTVSSSAITEAMEVGKVNDWDTFNKHIFISLGASAAYEAAFAAAMLAIKDESDSPLQGGNVLHSTVASSMSAKRAINSVSYATSALSVMGREPINYLNILQDLDKELSI